MINIHCTICGNQRSDQDQIVYTLDTIADEHQISIRQCSQCNNVYSFFDQDIDVDKYYDDKDYCIQNTEKTIFYTIQKKEYKAVLNKAKKILVVSNPTLLDFGSGKGLLLHFAQELGFKVKGVETSVPRAAYARERFGVEVTSSFYTDGKIFDTEFDVITCMHVLEHLPSPTVLFQNLIQHNLKANGLIILEVPNYHSWQSKWAGKHWLHLDTPRHLSHFTQVQIKSLIHQANCRIIQEEFFSLHLGIIGMAQTLLNKLGYKGFLMADLKHQRNFSLLCKVLAILPFAFILEIIACIYKRGGIMRVYAIKNS